MKAYLRPNVFLWVEPQELWGHLRAFPWWWGEDKDIPYGLQCSEPSWCKLHSLSCYLSLLNGPLLLLFSLYNLFSHSSRTLSIKMQTSLCHLCIKLSSGFALQFGYLVITLYSSCGHYTPNSGLWSPMKPLPPPASPALSQVTVPLQNVLPGTVVILLSLKHVPGPLYLHP